MKKSYLVHCQPEITRDGRLVHFKNREELLNMLGFCAYETQTAEIRQKEEAQEVPENDTPGSWSEKHHYAGPPRSPFGTMGREAELADETRKILVDPRTNNFGPPFKGLTTSSLGWSPASPMRREES